VVQWGDKFWLKEVKAKDGINPDAVDSKIRQKNPYIPIHVPMTELEHVPEWVGISSMALHLKGFGTGFTVFPIEFVSGYGWAIRDDKQLLLRRKQSISLTTFLTIHLGIFPDKAKGTAANRFDTSKPWTVAVDFEFSPASVGTLYDDDVKISMKRNWDYVKYATQAKYAKLLPSSGSSATSSPSTGPSAPKSPATEKKPATGKDGSPFGVSDPNFQITIPLPF
jgi:hypothetical protein